MVKSVNSKKTIKKIRRGLSIYRTGRSPFWHARIYDPVKKKYVVRSTKETNRIEAIEVAEEILETYKSKQNSSHATSKNSIRALAISGVSLITETPLAVIFLIGDLTTLNIMSIS